MTRLAESMAICPICAAAVSSFRFAARSPYRGDIAPYSVFACGSCGHRWCEGDLSPDLLDSIYSSGFHDTAQQSAGGVDGHQLDLSAPVYANAAARAAWLKGMGLNGRLLDVGAGAGYFVLAANREGFAAEGLDLSPEAARKAEALGVTVVQADFLGDDLRAETYDVVTLWDALCGMVDPHACMSRVAEHLPPGGRCVMTIAHGQSLVARVAGRRWPLMIPPVNLHFFSRKSMAALLASHDLSLAEWRPLGKKVSVLFALQKLVRSLGLGGLAPTLERLVPRHWAIVLNLGDIVTVVAVRGRSAETPA